MPTFRVSIDGAELVIKLSSVTGKETILYDGAVVSEKKSSLEAGIDSISLNPDSVLNVIERVAEAEGEAAGAAS